MSDAGPLIALVDNARAAGSGPLILSPAVGILHGIPPQGKVLIGGEAFARLTILGRSRLLLLPQEAAGVVTDLAVPGFGADAIPVEYGQPLFSLEPIDAAGVTRAVKAGPARLVPPAADRHPIPPGCHAIVAPADGVFYRRSRPTEPTYVEAGVSVREGQTLALIEAMKCFSAITYGGAGLPEDGEIVEILAEDGAEVRHGQTLFIVRDGARIR